MEANIDRNFGYRTSRSQEESEGSPLVRPVNIRAGELDWSASAEGAHVPLLTRQLIEVLMKVSGDVADADINEEYNPPVDLIVGSDIIYAEEAVPLLINALNILSSPKTNILIAHEGRSKDIDAKFEELAAQHFDIEVPLPTIITTNRRHSPRRISDAYLAHHTNQVLDWDEFDPVYRCDEICIIKLQKKSS
jgi:predicted nicotinamide N-methyase